MNKNKQQEQSKGQNRAKDNTIIAKAWKDPNFKKQLLESPKTTLEQMGYYFPSDVIVKVIAEEKNTYTLIIPHCPSLQSAESLSVEQLANLAAGAQCCNMTPATG